MPKVLIPVDGSDNARRAVRHAARILCLIPNIEVHLLNVQDAPDPRRHAYQSHAEIASEEFGLAERVLGEAEDILAAECGVKATRAITFGEVPEAIAAYARDQKCDAVIMGTRGMTALGNLLLGSVANQVVHRLDIPVTLVK